MKNVIISIATPKGGVGKTTTAVNLAVGFSMKNKKILLIDADPGGYCSSAFGFDKEKIFANLMDIFNGSKNIRDTIHSTELNKLEIIPFEKLHYTDEVKFNKLTENKYILKESLNHIKHFYDYIIIDCPPFLYGSTINSLIASDYLIIPVNSSKFSLDAIDKMLHFTEELKNNENSNLKIDGLLLTMYEVNTKASFQMKRELFAKYPNLVFKTTIPKNTVVATSTFYNKPILLLNKNAKASIAYLNLVEEIIDKHETNNLMLLSGMQNYDFNYAE